MGGALKCLICRGTPAFTWPRDINARQEWTKFVSKYCPEKIDLPVGNHLVYVTDISAKTVSKTMMNMSGI